MKRFRIRITSGGERGRYVGPRFGGYGSNPEVQKNPPVNVPGYGLWEQEAVATEFFDGNASYVQAEMRALGYDTELVEVE